MTDRHARSRARRNGAIGVLAASVALAGCAYDVARVDRAWAYSGREPMRGLLQEALQSAKLACAAETGASATPSVLWGYGPRLLACMESRGWIRAGNPL